jgi:hypothetical protein
MFCVDAQFAAQKGVIAQIVIIFSFSEFPRPGRRQAKKGDLWLY